MTTIPTAIRIVRLSLAAALLVATVPTRSVAASVPQAQDAGQAEPGTPAAVTKPAPSTLPSLGAVGFGWG